MNKLNRKILLASKSPRRKQLLTEAGFNFELVNVDVEEIYDPAMPPVEVPIFLAEKKAIAATDYLKDDVVILAADSVVILDDVVYEKPLDTADAKRMLRALSGRTHQVVTGVCLISSQEKVSFSGTSDVKMGVLSEAEMDYYIQRYQPYDKAGGYGIQEWIGHCKVEQIVGSYTNIMGLPMHLVYKHFMQLK